jgi:hypothetical protein
MNLKIILFLYYRDWVYFSCQFDAMFTSIGAFGGIQNKRTKMQLGEIQRLNIAARHTLLILEHAQVKLETFFLELKRYRVRVWLFKKKTY